MGERRRDEKMKTWIKREREREREREQNENMERLREWDY